jgi:hypothetical protein
MKLKNKKAQMWGYSLSLGILLVVLVLALIPSVKSFVDTAMSPTVGDTIGLDCDNADISNFTRVTCIITDFSLFYFCSALLILSISVITAKIVF